jgi:peptidoglycan/LPS O-acetylase OafA/YrhL
MDIESALRENGGKAPGFHFVRHALSVVILLHHASIAAIGPERAPAATKGDAVASLSMLLQGGDAVFLRQSVIELLRPFLFSLVGAFFVLSGFLVAGSAFRTRDVSQFLGFRALRILPALGSEVLLSALVLGPLVTSWSLGAYFSDPLFLRYFGNVLGFVSFELPGVFTDNPIPSQVNANLWTLPPEFYCYLVMSALMASGVVFMRRGFLLAFAAVSLAAALVSAFGGDIAPTRLDTTRFSSWFIVYLFVVGVALWAYGRLVPLDRRLFFLCGGLYVLLMATKASDFLAGLCLAYCVVYVGMMRFPLFDRLAPLDLSYGLYLYGYPITQALVFFLGPSLAGAEKGVRLAAIMGPALVLTLLFAWASWMFVEKPTLRLKRFVPTSRGVPFVSAWFLHHQATKSTKAPAE